MGISRREFFYAAGLVAYDTAGLNSRTRIERTLAGQDVDRPPFSGWHHFGLESKAPAVFAEATIDFHMQSGTDLVKVMSDFPYPRGGGDFA